jgi:hypothetical protein
MIKHFYYDEFGNIFFSRIKALVSSNPCFFNYHDDFFSNQDWSKEPIESLKTLYKQRAEQIREKYNYVVLCYSGGIDSTQILETFYYNNIHIDEIVMVGAFSQDSFKGSDENHNGEIYENCLPVLKNMNLSKTKITLLDYSKHFHNIRNFTLIDQYGSDFYKHLGVRTSVSRLFWNDLDKYVKSPENTAYIFGREKPNIFYEYGTKRYGIYFSDYSFMTGVREKYSNGNSVSFYTDPDCFKLMLKQCHSIIKKHQIDIHFSTEHRLSPDYIEKIIYDIKNPLAYLSQKSKYTFLSNKDLFIINHKNSDIYKIFTESLLKIKKNIDMLEYQKSIISKYYYIQCQQ